jgi:hypothetical protein
MNSDNNHKLSHTKTPAAISLKTYKAPRLTSYGDASKQTKALGIGKGQDGTWWWFISKSN